MLKRAPPMPRRPSRNRRVPILLLQQRTRRTASHPCSSRTKGGNRRVCVRCLRVTLSEESMAEKRKEHKSARDAGAAAGEGSLLDQNAGGAAGEGSLLDQIV